MIKAVTCFHNFSVSRSRLVSFVLAWWFVIPLLTLAYYVRAWSMYGMTDSVDQALNSSWGMTALNSGIFNLYRNSNSDYPPLFMMFLTIVEAIRRVTPYSSNDPLIMPLYRLLPIAAELGLILVAVFWLRDRRVLRWLIPLVLSLAPGLVVTTAFWGQSDAVYTLLVVLTLVALNRDKPLAAWIFFSLGMLTKFQTAAILPLLVILSWRRYGLFRTALGAAIAVVVFVSFLTPFVLSSGLENALRPFLNAVGHYPSVTVSAYNLWYLLTGLSSGVPPQPIADSLAAVGSVTYRQIGLLLLALNTLLVCVSMLRRPKSKLEFVWGSALYWGFFVLTTQMHERYLYPGTVLIILAIAQDRRFWFAALVSIFTYTYNVMSFTTEPFIYVGIPLFILLTGINLLIAFLNILVYLDVMFITILREGQALLAHIWTRNILVISAAFGALLLAVNLWAYSRTAQWLADHAATSSRIVYEDGAGAAYYLSEGYPVAQTWDWQRSAKLKDTTPDALIGQGVHYLIINDVNDDLFARHLNTLTQQGATLLYEADTPPTSHHAVLWTFSPDVTLNVSFDNTLELVGYRWQKSSLLLYWYAHQTTTFPYQIFVHILDANTGEMIDQTDQPVGAFSHPTSDWRRNELVFQRIDLPPDAQGAQIQIGLYELASGRRAQITDGEGNTLGEFVVLK